MGVGGCNADILGIEGLKGQNSRKFLEQPSHHTCDTESVEGQNSARFIGVGFCDEDRAVSEIMTCETQTSAVTLSPSFVGAHFLGSLFPRQRSCLWRQAAHADWY